MIIGYLRLKLASKKYVFIAHTKQCRTQVTCNVSKYSFNTYNLISCFINWSNNLKNAIMKNKHKRTFPFTPIYILPFIFYERFKFSFWDAECILILLTNEYMFTLGLPSLLKVIIVPYKQESRSKDISNIKGR